MTDRLFHDLPNEEVIAHKRVRERHDPIRGRTRIGLSITPMIDVVFLLLIYFMAATSFKMGEGIFRLDLPERGSAWQETDPFQLDDEPLRIAVSSLGAQRDAYRVRLSGPYEQPLSFDDLLEFLRSRRLSPYAPGGLFAPDHPIIVEGATGARWEHVVEAFSVAMRAGYTNITFTKAH